MAKILQMINAVYPYRGGMALVTEDIMNTLSERRDIEQKVISFNKDAEYEGTVTHIGETVHDMLNGVEVIRCGSIAEIFSQPLSFRYYWELKALMTGFRPDIVILHYPNPLAAFMILPYLKADRNIKFVLYWHLDITRQKILGKLFHGQTMSLLERADAVVATSPAYIDGSKYLGRFRNKITVIPCCVDTRLRKVTPETEQRAKEIRQKYEGKTISFSVGRLVAYKGYEYLIEASEYLSDDFAVLIAGGGKLMNTLRQKLTGKTELLGIVSDEELNAYYLASDIIAFPSITKNEAFGISLAEGMYFGKPAVTFTIPGSGVNYVNLDGITGIECPNRDARAFADAMMKLKNDEGLRRTLGENARRRVAENFMYDTFKDKILALISNLLNK